jgi:hypothetical protein
MRNLTNTAPIQEIKQYRIEKTKSLTKKTKEKLNLDGNHLFKLNEIRKRSTRVITSQEKIQNHFSVKEEENEENKMKTFKHGQNGRLKYVSLARFPTVSSMDTDTDTTQTLTQRHR